MTNTEFFNKMSELWDSLLDKHDKIKDVAEEFSIQVHKKYDNANISFFWDDETDVDDVADSMLYLGTQYNIKNYAVISNCENDVTIVITLLEDKTKGAKND